MVRPLLLIGSLLLATVPARAEDFTGFYAGVNAGYGWGRETTKGVERISRGPAGFPGAGQADDGLPPSATAAATGLQRPGTGRTAAGR
jgi:hypothetical protein